MKRKRNNNEKIISDFAILDIFTLQCVIDNKSYISLKCQENGSNGKRNQIYVLCH